MTKCDQCHKETERNYLNYDGGSHYYCGDCTEKIADRFNKIFGLWAEADGIDFADVVAILSVIHRDKVAGCYTINDVDLERMKGKIRIGERVDPLPDGDES